MVQLDTDLETEGLKEVVARYKRIYREHVGSDFPQGPMEQVQASIEAVFKSWMGDRARQVPRDPRSPRTPGTAVNVQAMVFGNMGDDSATGVAFTRNPPPARTSSSASSWSTPRAKTSSPASTPSTAHRDGQVEHQVRKELLKVKGLLEKLHKDVEDFEFTIEKGKLYMLQTRTGKQRRGGRPHRRRDGQGTLDRRAHRRSSRGPVGTGPTAAPRSTPAPTARCSPRVCPPPPAAVGKLAFTANEAHERTRTARRSS